MRSPAIPADPAPTGDAPDVAGDDVAGDDAADDPCHVDDGEGQSEIVAPDDPDFFDVADGGVSVKVLERVAPSRAELQAAIAVEVDVIDRIEELKLDILAAQARLESIDDELSSLRRQLDGVSERRTDAATTLAELDMTLAELETERDAMASEAQQQLEAISQTRSQLAASAVAGYVAGPERTTAALLAGSGSDPTARTAYLDVIAGRDDAALRAHQAALEAASGDVIRLDGELAEALRLQAAAQTEHATLAETHAQLTEQIAVLEDERSGAAGELDSLSGEMEHLETLREALAAQTDAARARLAVLQAQPGSQLAFPVAGHYSFYNGWGDPRSGGRRHQGTDIITPYGTPLVAIEDGVIVKKDWNKLGGWKLWVYGDSGTRYYYAHFASYADGIANGVRVTVGQVVGYAGDTGNAGTSHLHIETHLPGIGPVNPYPLMKALSDATRSGRDVFVDDSQPHTH